MPAALGVFGATFAYFNATAKAENVITSGNIKMELKQTDKDGKAITENSITGFMPGDTIDRIIAVENTGNQPLYAKICLEYNIESLQKDTNSGSEPDLSEEELDQVLLNLNTDDWEFKDGFFYYKTKLNPGETSKPLLSGILMDENAGNEYADTKLSLDIKAAGVQCKNNGETALTATGWPAE